MSGNDSGEGDRNDRGEGAALNALSNLSEMDRQLLGRLCQAGGGRAGRALATILGDKQVRVELFETGVSELNSTTEHLIDPKSKVVAVLFELGAPLRGHLAMLIPEASARALCEQLVGSPSVDETGAFDENGRGALSEVGNIVASAFLNAFADALRRSCIPSPPYLMHATDAEVLEHIGLAGQGQNALAITLEARIEAYGKQVRGGILFIPNAPFLEMLMGPAGPESR